MTTIYAFAAKTREQADALEARGAVYYPTMQQWVAKGLSSWALRKLKNKGIVPQATPGVIETTEPPLEWPAWIKVITFGPAIGMFCYMGFQTISDNFPFEGIAATILATLVVLAFSIMFLRVPFYISYAFYRRLRGDHRYWQEITTHTKPRQSDVLGSSQHSMSYESSTETSNRIYDDYRTSIGYSHMPQNSHYTNS